MRLGVYSCSVGVFTFIDVPSNSLTDTYMYVLYRANQCNIIIHIFYYNLWFL